MQGISLEMYPSPVIGEDYDPYVDNWDDDEWEDPLDASFYEDADKRWAELFPIEKDTMEDNDNLPIVAQLRCEHTVFKMRANDE